MTDNATSSDNAGGTVPWTAGITDPDMRGYAELKGWGSPDKAIESYRNLETKMGAPPERLFRLPEKPDDPAWNDIKTKLGFAAPEKPEEYELDIPEGFTPDYAQKAAEWAKELGIPKSMLKGLAAKQNEYVLAQMEAQESANQVRIDAALAKLRAEWGGEYDTTMSLARRVEEKARAEVGLSDEAAKAWSDADPEAYFKLMAFFGSKTGEAPMIEGGDSPTPVAMSPEAAKVKIKSLMQDKDWYARWNAGDVGARAEWDRLNGILASAAKR